VAHFHAEYQHHEVMIAIETCRRHEPTGGRQEYQHHEVMIAIETLEVLEGKLPTKKLQRAATAGFAVPTKVLEGKLPTKKLQQVLQWAQLHKAELHENWRRSQCYQALLPIAPLAY